MRFVIGCLLLAGCSTTVPIAVITKRGDVLTGTATATMSEGSFAVSNAAMRCAGSYDQWEMKPTLAYRADCSDGRRAVGTIERDKSLMAGRGVIEISDGDSGEVIMGPAATVYAPKVHGP